MKKKLLVTLALVGLTLGALAAGPNAFAEHAAFCATGQTQYEGTSSNDTMPSGGGGYSSAACADGHAGNDSITGSGQADVLIGGKGVDTISAGTGNDTLYDGSYTNGGKVGDGYVDSLTGGGGTGDVCYGEYIDSFTTCETQYMTSPFGYSSVWNSAAPTNAYKVAESGGVYGKADVWSYFHNVQGDDYLNLVIGSQPLSETRSVVFPGQENNTGISLVQVQQATTKNDGTSCGNVSLQPGSDWVYIQNGTVGAGNGGTGDNPVVVVSPATSHDVTGSGGDGVTIDHYNMSPRDEKTVLYSEFRYTGGTYYACGSGVSWSSSDGLASDVTGNTASDGDNGGHKGITPWDTALWYGDVQDNQPAGHMLKCASPLANSNDITGTTSHHLWPLDGSDSSSTNPQSPYEGAILQLANTTAVNNIIAGLGSQVQALAHTLQTYGCIIGDESGNGHAVNLKLETSTAWGPQMSSASALSSLPWTDPTTGNATGYWTIVCEHVDANGHCTVN